MTTNSNCHADEIIEICHAVTSTTQYDGATFAKMHTASQAATTSWGKMFSPPRKVAVRKRMFRTNFFLQRQLWKNNIAVDLVVHQLVHYWMLDLIRFLSNNCRAATAIATPRRRNKSDDLLLRPVVLHHPHIAIPEKAERPGGTVSLS